MITFYVLYDAFSRQFVASGKGCRMTYNLNAAKHFTSEWSANNFRSSNNNLECLTVKKIVRQ